MEQIVLPFVLKRKCCSDVKYLKDMKMKESIKLKKMLQHSFAENEKLKDDLVEKIEKEIPLDINRNKLINLKRDIFNNRNNRFVNKVIDIENKDLQKSIIAYQDKVREMLSLEEQLKEKFNDEYHNAREKMQCGYKNEELVSGLKHVSLSAYKKIDKYIETPVSKHTTSYRKFDRTLAKVITRASLKPSPFSTFVKVGISKLGEPKKVRIEKDSILKLQLNETYILRLYDNFLRIPEVICKCSFSLQDKLNVFNDCIDIIYEYDKEKNSKVFETSSRYIRLPYKGNIKVLYDKLKEKKVLSMEEIAEMFGQKSDDAGVIRFVCKCVDNGLIKFENKLDPAQDNLLEACLKNIWNITDEKTGKIYELVDLIEEIIQYRELYNNTSIDKERVKYIEFIKRNFIECYKCIDYECNIENLFYEDYIDHSIESKEYNEQIINDLNNICKVSTVFDINFRTQLYFAHMFKKYFNKEKINYKDPKIMMLLTEATQKYSKLWANEWEIDLEKEENKDILLLENKKKKFLDYLQDNKDKEEIIITDEILDEVLSGLPEYLKERECSMDFFLQEAADGKVVINDIYPGYLTFISRFLDYIEDEEIKELKDKYIDEVFNQNYKIAEVYEVYGFNANRHNPIADRRVIFNERESSSNLFRRNINMNKVELMYNEKTHRVDFYDENSEVFNPKHIGSLITILMKGEHAFVSNLGNNVLTLPPIYKAFLPENCNEIIKIPRVVYNNLILSRQNWIVPSEFIPSKTQKMEMQEYYFAINKWLEDNKIPKSVYIKVESSKTDEDTENYGVDYSANKPQYIDFENPVLVQLFDNMTTKCKYVKFEEALPDYVEEDLGDSAEEYIVEITNTRRK